MTYVSVDDLYDEVEKLRKSYRAVSGFDRSLVTRNPTREEQLQILQIKATLKVAAALEGLKR